MNKKEALEFTKDRIEAIESQTLSNNHELEIKEETLEYLRYVQGVLQGVDIE